MMDVHEHAMTLASEAQLLQLEGREEAGRGKLERAAELEQQAADLASEDRVRTRGILRISAVSLWLQAGRPQRAVEVASRYLCEPLDAAFARELDELRILCERSAQAASTLPMVPGDFLQRAREREEAFARGEIASGSVANPRLAA